jgi:hypothetical protein
MVALAERLRLELDSSDRKNLVGSQIIPESRITGGDDYGVYQSWPER